MASEVRRRATMESRSVKDRSTHLIQRRSNRSPPRIGIDAMRPIFWVRRKSGGSFSNGMGPDLRSVILQDGAQVRFAEHDDAVQ
jgi:hypothetical protein